MTSPGTFRSVFSSLKSRYFAQLRNMSTVKVEDQLRARYPDIILAEGVIVKGPDRLFAGKKLFLDVRAYLNCAGGDWNKEAGYIKTGDNVEIGPYSVLWGAGGITLGNNVHLGAHVSITAHEAKQVPPENVDAFGPLDMEYGAVVIEDHVLLCSGAVVIPGVRIGHHAMIGGGAVVTRDIPPYALAAGCPARIIRFSNEKQLKLHVAGVETLAETA